MKIQLKSVLIIFTFSLLIFCLLNCVSFDKKNSAPSIQILVKVSLEKQFPNANMSDIMGVLQGRVKAADYDAEMKPIGDSMVKINLYGDYDLELVKKMFSASGRLQFWELYSLSELAQDHILDNADKAFEKIIEGTIKKDKDFQNDLSYENKKHLSYYLRFMVDQQGRAIDGGNIGFVSTKDTAILREYLESPSIRINFPSDLVWMYGIPESISQKKEGIIPLFAAKTYGSNKAQIEDEVISNAQARHDPITKKMEVVFSMNAIGSKIWAKMTERNIRKFIAIAIDNFIYSAPRVTDKIEGGQSSISGNFTREEATDLAAILNGGRLPASLSIISIKKISEN